MLVCTLSHFMMRFHGKILSGLAAFLLCASVAGCGGLVVQPEPLQDISPPPGDARPSPVAFNKIRYQIPTGTPLVSSSPKGPFGLLSCSFPYGLMEQGGVSSRLFPTDDYRRVFLDTLAGQGYDVAGDPGRLFDEEEDEMRAVYSVGARVIDVKADLCRKTTLFTSVYRGHTGEANITIEWTVFDLLNRRNAYKTITRGYARLDLPNHEAVPLLMERAFAAAVHNLGADEQFHELVFYGSTPRDIPYTYEDPYESPEARFNPRESVIWPDLPISKRPAVQWLDDIRRSVVLIQAGPGHGSGFFITEDGHILTNAHVVGNAGRVRVVTSGKEEALLADVLRVDRRRDVALLRLETPPEQTPSVLPARLDMPKIGEDVYAIGAPSYTRLQDTVTKGIVSAHRIDRRTGLSEIQADVIVHGGNSGSPLLDAYGNILGLSVSTYAQGEERLSGLSTFIPLQNALQAIDIKTKNMDSESSGQHGPQTLLP